MGSKSKRNMNREEKMVEEYLLHLGYNKSNIKHQPNGQRTPDFAIGGEVAIEVRRLNKHFHNGEKVEPLEHLNINIHRFITGILDTFNASPFDRSCYVTYVFERPIKLSKELRKSIQTALESHLSILDQRHSVRVHKNLVLEFLPTEIKYGRPYVWGVSSDDNSGGFVVADLHKNLPIAVREKEEKAKAYYHEYKSWWLALVDYIGYGLDELDLRQFNANPPIKTIFDKIILVSPMNPKRGNEIIIEKTSFT